MKTFILASLTALTLTLTNSADAQGVHFSFGGGAAYGSFGHGGHGSLHGGHGFQHGYGFQSGYGGHLHHNVNPHLVQPGNGHLHWHDTSHYDYVPGRFVRHGCHYHYIPGQTILHRDGHFDLHH